MTISTQGRAQVDPNTHRGPFDIRSACPGCGQSGDVFHHVIHRPGLIGRPGNYYRSIRRECLACGQRWREILGPTEETT